MENAKRLKAELLLSGVLTHLEVLHRLQRGEFVSPDEINPAATALSEVSQWLADAVESINDAEQERWPHHGPRRQPTATELAFGCMLKSIYTDEAVQNMVYDGSPFFLGMPKGVGND